MKESCTWRPGDTHSDGGDYLRLTTTRSTPGLTSKSGVSRGVYSQPKSEIYIIIDQQEAGTVKGM